MLKSSSSVTSSSPATEKMSGRWCLSLVMWTAIPLVVWNGLFIALWIAGWQVQEENGPMENLQAMFLLVGCGLLFWSVARAANEGKVLCAGLGLLYLTFLVREVDLRAYDLPVINSILNGMVRNLWLGTLWMFGALWFVRHRLVTWRLFRKWLPTTGGFLLMAAGILWVLPAAEDKLHMIHPGARSLFVEELLETNAGWLMLVSAGQVWRKPPADLG